MFTGASHLSHTLPRFALWAPQRVTLGCGDNAQPFDENRLDHLRQSLEIRVAHPQPPTAAARGHSRMPSPCEKVSQGEFHSAPWTTHGFTFRGHGS